MAANKKYAAIRRGIYLGRALHAMIRLGDKSSVRRAMRELEHENRYTYEAAVRTVRHNSGRFDN